MLANSDKVLANSNKVLANSDKVLASSNKEVCADSICTHACMWLTVAGTHVRMQGCTDASMPA